MAKHGYKNSGLKEDMIVGALLSMSIGIWIIAILIWAGA